MNSRRLTVGEARLAARNLLHRSSAVAQIEADILLAQVLSIDRGLLDVLTDADLNCEQQTQFSHLVSRRIAYEPLAYITKQKEFWSLVFEVDETTLVPRPETEHVVERALHRCNGIENPQIVDLGTGCGTIALALASELKDANIIATDSSRAALMAARNNQQRFGIQNTHFIQGDWMTALRHQQFDLIVANPPYIRVDDPCLKDKAMSYEPRSALVGGVDGTEAIRTIITSSKQHLKSGGWLVLEHGFDQAKSVQTLMKQADLNHIKTFQDLAGLDRVTEARAL